MSDRLTMQQIDEMYDMWPNLTRREAEPLFAAARQGIEAGEKIAKARQGHCPECGTYRPDLFTAAMKPTRSGRECPVCRRHIMTDSGCPVCDYITPHSEGLTEQELAVWWNMSASFHTIPLYQKVHAAARQGIEARNAAPLRKYYEGYNARIDALEAALRDIRNKAHAHNRGGEMYAGLRDVIRDICDAALRRDGQ